ncbi:hypothetical protein L5515_012497 [Caenorhabditis briggsae]|uniref:Uncharacterized protein n=1 Tax=Caenorhabditis briggsae TaxID=6238 RepID=A0AAE9ESS4_CAEBR|nr:hypothetical protein L5515_012497 [Caenorhabditis briggsae]
MGRISRWTTRWRWSWWTRRTRRLGRIPRLWIWRTRWMGRIPRRQPRRKSRRMGGTKWRTRRLGRKPRWRTTGWKWRRTRRMGRKFRRRWRRRTWWTTRTWRTRWMGWTWWKRRRRMGWMGTIRTRSPLGMGTPIVGWMGKRMVESSRYSNPQNYSNPFFAIIISEI